MFRKLFICLALSLQLAACAPHQPIAYPPPNTPPPSSDDPTHAILGTWFWNADSEAFYANGRGDYFRSGAVCFSFSYTVQNQTLHIVGDKQGACGTQDNTYQIALSPDTMTKTHTPSGFVSVWHRSPPKHGTPQVTTVVPITSNQPGTPATDFAIAPMPPAISLPANSPTRSIQLRTIVNRIPAATPIGANESGAGCAPRNALLASSLPLQPNSTMYHAFYDQMRGNGYKVLNDPDNMFQDKLVLRPELLIGVAVVAMKENICFSDGAQFLNMSTMAHTAELSLDLEWQVFDTVGNQMVTTLTTHGYAAAPNAGTGASTAAIREAFIANLNQLLADKAFRAVVTTAAKGTAPPVNTVAPIVNNIAATNPLLAALGMNAAAGAKAAVDFDRTNPPAPQPLPAGRKTHSLQLTKVINRLQLGTSIGANEGGADCVPKSGLMPTYQMAMPNSSWYRVFYQRLKSSGYEALSDPDDIFEDKNQLRPDFFVGAIITGEKRNVCFPDGVINAQSPQTAEVSLDIEWQVYDTLSKSLAVTVKTHSHVHRTIAEAGGAEKALDEAFTSNLNGLLDDATFRRVMMRDGGDAAATEDGAQERVIRLAQQPQLTGTIAGNIRAVQNAVVTVLVGGGHGSGFLIGRDGLILTDRHVVGGARQVKVKLSDGREMTAQVLASDTRHDVAVLRLQGGSGEVGLPVAIAPVSVGADVYAIGSPLTTSLANTLTKGVVSGYRVFDGVTHIQSDVSIQPGDSGGPLLDESGNVVGLTRAQMRLGVASTGVNFFIPISVALQAVNVAIDEGLR